MLDTLRADPLRTVALIAIVFTAGVFLCSTFTKRGLSAPRWVICARVLSTVCLLICGFLSFYLLAWGNVLFEVVHWRIMFGKTIIGCFGAGILFNVVDFRRVGAPLA